MQSVKGNGKVFYKFCRNFRESSGDDSHVVVGHFISCWSGRFLMYALGPFQSESDLKAAHEAAER